MSNQSSHGGSRPNAGRKTNAQLKYARDLIDQAVTKQDWLTAWAEMFTIIKTSTDPRAKTMAMRLVCEYRFGKPSATLAPIAEPEPPAPQPQTEPKAEIPIEEWLKTIIDYSDDIKYDFGDRDPRLPPRRALLVETPSRQTRARPIQRRLTWSHRSRHPASKNAHPRAQDS